MFYNEPIADVIRVCTDPACALKGVMGALITFAHHGIQLRDDARPCATVEESPCLAQ
jgi:hypothetical protein